MPTTVDVDDDDDVIAGGEGTATAGVDIRDDDDDDGLDEVVSSREPLTAGTGTHDGAAGRGGSDWRRSDEDADDDGDPMP